MGARAFCTVAMLSVAAVVASAQKDTPIPKSPGGDYPVTVAGCISGTRLLVTGGASATTDTASAAIGASEYVLDGPRELLRQIRKEHDRHYEEVSGIAKIERGTSGDRVHVAEKPIPKGRVVLGAREESGGPQRAPQPVRLIVKSVRHISASCAASAR